MVEVSSLDTFAEIIAIWNSQGYSENEIYRMLTAWDITINQEMLSYINQKSTIDKDTFENKQKQVNRLL